MTAPIQRVVTLDDLSRPQRLMLKRAYAATERRPLQIVNGPTARMQAVAEKMLDLGLVRLVRTQFFAVVLTQKGFDLAVALARQGWPNTERQATGRGQG